MRPVRVSTRWCARSCPQWPSSQAFVPLPIAIRRLTHSSTVVGRVERRSGHGARARRRPAAGHSSRRGLRRSRCRGDGRHRDPARISARIRRPPARGFRAAGGPSDAVGGRCFPAACEVFRPAHPSQRPDLGECLRDRPADSGFRIRGCRYEPPSFADGGRPHDRTHPSRDPRLRHNRAASDAVRVPCPGLPAAHDGRHLRRARRARDRDVPARAAVRPGGRRRRVGAGRLACLVPGRAVPRLGVGPAEGGPQPPIRGMQESTGLAS